MVTRGYVANGTGRDMLILLDMTNRSGKEAYNSSASPIKMPGQQPRGAPQEVRQQRHLHSIRKTKDQQTLRWEKMQVKDTKVNLPKCKSLPQYFASTYGATSGNGNGFSMPPLETQVSLLGDTHGRKPAEFKYGLGVDDASRTETSTYADLGQIPGFVNGIYGKPVKHHSLATGGPVFPDVPDIAKWRPGVGPPTNPDPALEAKFFRSTLMDLGEGFRPGSRNRPSKHHTHSFIGDKAMDADHVHGQKWEIRNCNPPGVGDPVNPDPAKEGRFFSATYADLGNSSHHWQRKDEWKTKSMRQAHTSYKEDEFRRTWSSPHLQKRS